MNFDWRALPGGLLLREDDFSWQGAVEGDEHFFLRRSKDAPDEITDAIFGSVNDAHAANLLAIFLRETGGLNPNDLGQSRLVFRSVLVQDDANGNAKEKVAQLRMIADEAIRWLGSQLIESSSRRDGTGTMLVCEFKSA